MYCCSSYFLRLLQKKVYRLTVLAATEDISSVSLQNQFPLFAKVFKIRKNLCAVFGPDNKWQSMRT